MIKKSSFGKKSDLNNFYQKIYSKFHVKIFLLYQWFIKNIKLLKFFFLFISVLFGISRTVFYNGYNIDSYHVYAQAIQTFILTRTKNAIFLKYYARHRILYPLIVALAHIVIPIDIAILAALINLLSALGTIIMIPKIMEYFGAQSEPKELAQIFIMMSYNLLNFWFNIMPDITGLFIFMVFIYYFIGFFHSKKFNHLALSFLFLIMATFTREIFGFGFLLYILLIKKTNYQIIIFSVGSLIFILIMKLSPASLGFMDYFLAGYVYEDLYLNGKIFEMFIAMQRRWVNQSYVLGFFKGLIKVGILPSLGICIGFLCNLVHQGKKSIKKIFVNKGFQVIFGWFVVYFLIYSLFYSDSASATGLRYWLPIAWIPLLFSGYSIYRLPKNEILKTFCILFLIGFPILWSSGEIYVNRYNAAGTGNLFASPQYINEFKSMSSISSKSTTKFDLSIQDKNILNINGLNLQPTDFNTSISLNFKLWLNVTKNLTVELRFLRQSNTTQVKFEIFAIKSTYAPGYGDLLINQDNLNYSTNLDTFQTVRFQYSGPFHIRLFKLTIIGTNRTNFGLDYLLLQNS